MSKKGVYLIGSLRGPVVPHVGVALRKLGFDVFDDWHGAGPEADDKWREYEQIRGRSYGEALAGRAAQHIFDFDHKYLNWCDIAVLILPAGKSGHLELGYAAGKQKLTYILFPDGEPDDRWDVMYQFSTNIFFSTDEMLDFFSEHLA